MRKWVAVLVCLIALCVVPCGAADDPDDATPEPTPVAVDTEQGKIKPIPDPVLAERIRAGIVATRHPALQAVTIRVEQGVVTMDGRLRTRQEKALAEAVARTLPGVRDVRSHIALEDGFRPPVPHGDRRSLVQMTVDEKLRGRAVSKLAGISGVRVSQLRIEVYDGVVIVGGIVPETTHVERIRHSLTHLADVRAFVLNLDTEQPAE